jgi:hypothetical protein
MSAAPAKDKKQIVVVSIFGALLLVFVVYAYNSFFGGSPNPAATAPSVTAPVVTRSSESRVETESTTIPAGNARKGEGPAPGVAAKRMASTSSSLDPTLDESAMLRTESLVYSGTGRNIFSSISAPPMVIPNNVPKARPGVVLPVMPPMPVGPPPPPPINLKYFGTAVRLNGRRQAFLLQGEDVYLASEGDIVARKYRIVSIGTNNIQVEDLVYKDTQTLPLIGR